MTCPGRSPVVTQATETYHGAPDEEYDDDYDGDNDRDDEDDGSECGAWINGKFDYYLCTQAGTEYCDWVCPYANEGRLQRIKQMKMKTTT